jgi:hypothetical protein
MLIWESRFLVLWPFGDVIFCQGTGKAYLVLYQALSSPVQAYEDYIW